MHYGKIKALSILVPPLLLAFSFFLTTTTLAEAAAPRPADTAVKFAHRVVDSGVILNSPTFDATRVVTDSLTISDVAITNVGATSALITWTTDETADSLVRYGTSTDALTFSASSSMTGTHHSVGLANLTPDTKYFFEVESTDGEGDTAVDDNSGNFYSFTTLGAEQARKGFVGTVVGNPAQTVTIVQQGTGKEATIILPEDYILKTPGGPRAGKFEDGARVVILAQRADDDWVALRVLVKPVKPNLPVVGVVTGVGPTSLTVLDPKGKAHLLRVDEELEELAPGEVVTVFPGNANRARGLVRAEEVHHRLQKLLNEFTESENSEATPEEEDFRGKRANALIKALEVHGAQQLQALDKALQHAPDEVKDKISAAKSKAQKALDAARSAVGKAKGKLKQSESNDSDDGPADGNGPDQASHGRGHTEGQGKGAGHSDSPGNSGNQGNAEGQGQGSGGNQGRGKAKVQG
jgi:hypothetical protein